ncbi:uncharacterized protein YbjT (DUF2867 family) [Thermonema lapsum]|uniref:Uncharacterized protein YbjT (DUF2867 family) n=1 Tax=Thermonema lapsum TaxID=28195 RepID=A0A846MPS0_9BACT|nr:NAD(P)H-binding protein [Thermonema lapsum]NIK73586.1 uncharacterized protein YbjT (DUF2867 family) [Thermonema lapsum]
MKKIAVFGATGMLGKPVTEELIAAGFEVYVCARDLKKAEKLFGSKAKYVLCDLRDKNAVNNALKGMDAVYCNLSVSPTEKENDFHPEKEGLQFILQAAKNHNIQRLGYISSIIAKEYNKNDWWVMRLKKEAIQAIKNSGISYCIFYPSSYMENLNNGFIQGNKVNIVGKPLYKNWWIAGRDYGKQVARSFQVLDPASSRDYVVQGPEALFPEEAVDIFIQHYKKQNLKKAKAPIGLLKFIGLFNPQLAYISKILDIINTTPEPFMAQQTWDELGKPEITIKAYAESLNE